MIKDAIEKIEEMSKPEVIKINGVEYCNKKLHRVRIDDRPQPEILTVNTLTGLLDYVKNNLDDQKKYVIHVHNSRSVVLYGEFEPEWGRRKQYVEAQFNGFNIDFGSYCENDKLTVKLMTQFFENDQVCSLLQIVGNVTDEKTSTTDDDGMTQRVVTKTGIARKEEVKIANPYTLQPRRTFVEIVGIEAPFVVRGRTGRDNPEFAIFECDGGQWELDAIHAIRDYLKKSLIDQDVVIIA